MKEYPTLGEVRQLAERQAILKRLEAFGWNRVRTADSLGISRVTLRAKMIQYGIVRDDSASGDP